MPSTSIYGLPFEQSPGDEPGYTLDGGQSGNEPILAEAVETELERIDGDVSDVQDQLARGWSPIDAGTETGAFAIDVTNNGEFPALTFAQVRVTLWGGIDEVTNLMCRVNNDDASNLHRLGRFMVQTNDGSFDSNFSGTQASWVMAEWGAATTNTCVLTVFNTDENAQLSYESIGGRNGSGATNRVRSFGHGDLASSRTLSFLQFFPQSGSINQVRWIAEGYRI